MGKPLPFTLRVSWSLSASLSSAQGGLPPCLCWGHPHLVPLLCTAPTQEIQPSKERFQICPTLLQTWLLATSFTGCLGFLEVDALVMLPCIPQGRKSVLMPYEEILYSLFRGTKYLRCSHALEIFSVSREHFDTSLWERLGTKTFVSKERPFGPTLRMLIKSANISHSSTENIAHKASVSTSRLSDRYPQRFQCSY